MRTAMNRSKSKDIQFSIWKNSDDTYNSEQCQLAVLMDIRDELQRLNAVLHCPNFIGIPQTLRQIKENLPKRRKRKTKK